jgi:hypothetical protein
MKQKKVRQQTGSGRAKSNLDPVRRTADWRLPSGKALAEFALEAGFLAPSLLRGIPQAPSRVRKGNR